MAFTDEKLAQGVALKAEIDALDVEIGKLEDLEDVLMDWAERSDLYTVDLIFRYQENRRDMNEVVVGAETATIAMLLENLDVTRDYLVATRATKQAEFEAIAPTILVELVTVNVEGGGDPEVLVGASLQLEAVILPASADDQTVAWSVVDGTGEATIDENTGLLIGVVAGSVTAVATANDTGGVTGNLEITVI